MGSSIQAGIRSRVVSIAENNGHTVSVYLTYTGPAGPAKPSVNDLSRDYKRRCHAAIAKIANLPVYLGRGVCSAVSVGGYR